MTVSGAVERPGLYEVQVGQEISDPRSTCSRSARRAFAATFRATSSRASRTPRIRVRALLRRDDRRRQRARLRRGHRARSRRLPCRGGGRRDELPRSRERPAVRGLYQRPPSGAAVPAGCWTRCATSPPRSAATSPKTKRSSLSGRSSTAPCTRSPTGHRRDA